MQADGPQTGWGTGHGAEHAGGTGRDTQDFGGIIVVLVYRKQQNSTWNVNNYHKSILLSLFLFGYLTAPPPIMIVTKAQHAMSYHGCHAEKPPIKCQSPLLLENRPTPYNLTCSSLPGTLCAPYKCPSYTSKTFGCYL